MAISQWLQTSLFAATTTTSTTTNCRFFFRNFATCPSQLRPVMAKLQNRVLQNYNCSYLQNSSFCIGDKYEKCFQLRFRKIRVSCMINANQPRVIRLVSERNFHPFGSFVDGSTWALTSQPQLKVGHSNTMTPSNIFDGRSSGKTSPFKVFNKRWKRAKSLAAHKRNVEGGAQVAASNEALGMNASSSTKTPLKDTDVVNSRKKLVGDVTVDVSLGPSVSSSHVNNNNKVSKPKGKQNQQSRSKKNKEQCSGANAASDAAAEPGGSKRVSQANKSNTSKKNQSSPASDNNSNGNTPMEVADSSVSTKQQSERTTGKSRRKGKSIKETNVLVKTHEAPQVSSGNELAQKKNPHTNGKAKPQGQMRMQLLYPPTGKSVVVVESVTKAKVIQAYLGNMFEVLPSYSHVRDLAARSGSVRPDDDFSMVWEVPSAAWTHLKSIKVALAGAENLILASDPDREGEAIAWHIIEMLQQQDALCEAINVVRVVFNEITESSIKSALQAPREIDVNLVHAYFARRALDYLIGFNISPLLWRKLPGCQSAG
ncbi:hypothetical protein ACSBR1_016607 [Camellia fascicularis]